MSPTEDKNELLGLRKICNFKQKHLIHLSPSPMRPCVNYGQGQKPAFVYVIAVRANPFSLALGT